MTDISETSQIDNKLYLKFSPLLVQHIAFLHFRLCWLALETTKITHVHDTDKIYACNVQACRKEANMYFVIAEGGTFWKHRSDKPDLNFLHGHLIKIRYDLKKRKGNAKAKKKKKKAAARAEEKTTKWKYLPPQWLMFYPLPLEKYVPKKEAPP